MLTQITLRAKALNRNQVIFELVHIAATIKETHGGEWYELAPGLITNKSDDGWYGSITIKRKETK